MQEKRQTFLRLIGTSTEPKPRPAASDLVLEADKIEALNGPNPYSSFLRKHGSRPDRNQAIAIGRIMSARVRASDGSMQPELTRGEQEGIRSIRKRRREWAQKADHISRTLSAIEAIAQNSHDPETVASYGAEAFVDPTTREKLAKAVQWLQRIANSLEVPHVTCTQVTNSNNGGYPHSSVLRNDHAADCIRGSS